MHKRRIIATAALPYANGPIHLGHLVEHVQVDIWVRFMRLMGHDAAFLCADDAHGAPIMLAAEKAGMSPESWIEKMRTEHEADLRAFWIDYAHYGSTHGESTQATLYDIFEKLYKAGALEKRIVQQLYDESRGMFLADRYVKGECPSCGASDQYGDNCEVCGVTYDAITLKNPRSVLSDNAPVVRESAHYFFKLVDCRAILETWLKGDALQESVRNKLREWLQLEDLKDWDISRDSPYFGFLIPGEHDKYFYVWMDAPVGYIGATHDLSKTGTLPGGLRVEDFWQSEDAQREKTEVYHFVGKDITYFHGLFWPAVLSRAGYRTPSAIYAHGFLTLAGAKMSKSKGTFITAKSALEHLPFEVVRYYLAAHLNDGICDLDFEPARLIQLINTDIVGRLVNILSRSTKILEKYNDSRLSDTLDEAFLVHLEGEGKHLSALYEARKNAKVVSKVAALCDEVNAYLSQKAPWQSVKIEESREEALSVCSTAVAAYGQLIAYLSPILPKLASDSGEFLGWETLSFYPKRPSGTLPAYQALFTRISEADVAALFPFAP